MAPKSIFSSLVREVDGTWSTAYGTFNLKSALQPIFRRTMNGALDIDSFEGLVRPHRNGEPVTPGEFFSLVAPEDIENIDSILRTIHILNTGRLNRSRARVFVNFHPGLFQTPAKMRQEVERMRLTAHEAGMTADRIVCEISEKKVSDTQMVADFAYHMHDIGFRVALDDYGAGDSDIDRVKLIKPDYVKFEAGWVRDFMQNSAGAALLRVIVSQFRDDGIEPVFEGLETGRQVDICEDLGVLLMQGYVLAKPELAPTSFDARFPELGSGYFSPSPRSDRSTATPAFPREDRLAEPHTLRQTRTFGKRGL
ncbi:MULTISPECIES: EAL domain-containing protein [Rhizobium/Agrobacterium group]|jgi:EAL domain-containing protein (putative c-di-GMP-specific phosphodiesterase class I)|uniref:EAL domain-containing protein n=1 Tax=Agrobacterium tumefaciens TaxID=358 RepID=A0AAJ4MZQ7_AGRTU|nr:MULTISPECIES: EAL domain-containing protein [Rhizobium/Agrobacterium group]KQY42174.1 diguanylate phosphodiesterase [Rhizobium sp. Root491]MBO9109295.1 EAL domain-containing protein [Agrobacterium sp. S2/73]MDP9762296.1 EAL domain-containing protein (putative c-di-GMP-specific phosphodiesterase class I) [Agrobacterium tumefaciens]MDQ1223157.1 EAL domain-containing protein (putative c-di-GMP-specific phosphodiesterase class I) [Agrobacterium sp. SORGH_AS_0745]MDR5009095.1 EAL domain-containi